MKYIVFWCLMTVVSLGPQSYIDEFGREIYEYDLVYRTKQVMDCNHYKEFTNRDSAFAFYNRLLKVEELDNKPWHYWNRNLESILYPHIDSVEFPTPTIHSILHMLSDSAWVTIPDTIDFIRTFELIQYYDE